MLEALADAPGDSMRDVAEEIVGERRRFGEEGGERGRRAREECRGGTVKTYIAFWNDTNASLWGRRRGCYIGAERRERGAGGRNLQGKKVTLQVSDEKASKLHANSAGCCKR